MDVVSVSPFSTGSVLWRPRPDRWTLTVVCKATYSLAPGEGDARRRAGGARTSATTTGTTTRGGACTGRATSRRSSRART